MNTKKIKSLGKYILFGCVVSLTSCDIEEINPNNVTVENLNEENAEHLLNGCYDALQEPYLYRGGQYTNGVRDHDAMTDIAYNNWSTGLSEIADGQHDANHKMIQGFWKANYTGINSCNFFIQTLQSHHFALKDQYIAEAKFLRALFYFNLTSYYGNVPFFMTPIEREDAYYITNTRRTVILDSITSELNAAVDVLPYKHELSSNDIFRATKGSALGLLTRIYLHRASCLDQRNPDSYVWESLVDEKVDDSESRRFYALAKTTAERLMSSEFQYELSSSYENLFNGKNENGIESLFEVQFETGVGEGEAFSGTYKNPQPWFVPTIEYICTFEETDGSEISPEAYTQEGLLSKMDPRFYTSVLMTGQQWLGTDWTGAGINYGPDPYLKFATKKYIRPEQGYFTDGDRNFILIRYADILLMYAESKIKLGEIDDSLFDAVDQVRHRVGMPLWDRTITDPDTLFAKLQKERIREFGLEGLRYQDMIRWGIYSQLLDRVSSAGYSNDWSERRYVWPIPQVECDNNRSEEGLQNPMWK